MKKYLCYGDYVMLEEMPQGLLLHSTRDKNIVLISTTRDAKLLIESLQRLIASNERSNSAEYCPQCGAGWTEVSGNNIVTGRCGHKWNNK